MLKLFMRTLALKNSHRHSIKICLFLYYDINYSMISYNSLGMLLREIMNLTIYADITIVGAGPIGLLAAILFSSKNLKISVIDCNTEISIAEPKDDGRAVALNTETVSCLKSIGLWDQIDEKDKFPIMSAAVFDGDSNSYLSFDRESFKPVGFFVKNSIIRKALYNKIIQNSHINIYYEKRVKAIVENSYKKITIDCNDINFKQSLLIAADGRFSHLRNFAQISYKQKDFNRFMYLVEIKHKNSHHNKAIEQFMYGGLTCAILPLSDYCSSIALSVYKSKANLMNEDFLFKTINDCVERHIGEVEEIHSSHCYPLISTYAQSFFNQSLALIGDAAIGMHPVTAHGFNLGVYGIKTLAYEIHKIDLDSLLQKKLALLKYQFKLHLNAKPLYDMTNVIVQTFSSDSNHLLRKGILLAADKLPLWKDIVYARMGVKKMPFFHLLNQNNL